MEKEQDLFAALIDDKPLNKAMEGMILGLNRYLDLAPLPDWVRRRVRTNLANILQLNNDPPRPGILLLGRTGSGKSSLVNALFNARVCEVGHRQPVTPAVRPVDFVIGGLSFAWYDSPGFGELEGAASETGKTAEEQLQGCIDKVDLLVLVIPLRDVSRYIQKEVTELKRLKALFRDYAGREIPVLVAATQADAVDPLRAEPGSEQWQDHLRFVAEKVADGKDMLGTLVSDIIPVITHWHEYPRPDGTSIEKKVLWNVDGLVESINQLLPQLKQLAFARAQAQSVRVRRRVVSFLARELALTAGLIGWTPIPIADTPVLLALQGIGVTLVARVWGKEVTGRDAKKLVGTMIGVGGVGFGARELYRLIPGAGSAVAATIAAAVTYAVVEASGVYFETDGDLEATRRSFRERFAELRVGIQGDSDLVRALDE